MFRDFKLRMSVVVVVGRSARYSGGVLESDVLRFLSSEYEVFTCILHTIEKAVRGFCCHLVD